MKRSLETAVVLVSGGLDSCVTAALANNQYQPAFLHVNYGQRTEVRELKAFRDIADYYSVKQRLIADISYLKSIGGSSLTDRTFLGEESASANGGIPSTYVPFRNTHLLAIATSWAETIHARAIFIGAVEPDSSGYPDCRPGYFKAFNQLIKRGTRPDTDLTVFAPIINLRKKDIIIRGLQLKAPLHLTWSCYFRNRKACGVCESCILRLRGFKDAGIKDPIPYAGGVAGQ